MILLSEAAGRLRLLPVLFAPSSLWIDPFLEISFCEEPMHLGGFVTLRNLAISGSGRCSIRSLPILNTNENEGV